jgi:integrase
VNNHLIPYFGAGRIGDLRRENIRDFVKAMVDKGDLSSKSIHNILLVLHQILDDAQIEGLIHRNPYLKIEKPKREKPEVDYLRTHEIPIFLTAAQTYKEPKEKISKIPKGPEEAEKKKEKPKCETTIHALFFTAIFTGMRRGELLGLQWSDIDWVNSKIHLRRSLYKGSYQTPKSEYSKRAIDMGPRLIQTLKEHRAKQNETRLKVGSGWTNEGLVFSDNEGNPLDADNLYHRDFKAILKKAELRAIRIHDLRHTFASILIAAGHNLKYIQNQMGHSSIKVTMDLYGHLMPEVYQGAAQKSENFVFGNVMVTDNKKEVTACAVTPNFSW